MKLHLRTAADDGVWLCCVGCFQNSSPQTSLAISSRKVQPDPLAFFILSVSKLRMGRERQLVTLEVSGDMGCLFQFLILEADFGGS